MGGECIHVGVGMVVRTCCMHCMTNDPPISFHCRIIFGPPTVTWPRSCLTPPEPFFCVPQYASVALLCVRSGLDAWRDGGQSSLFWGRRKGPSFSTRPDLNRDKKTCLKPIPVFLPLFLSFFPLHILPFPRSSSSSSYYDYSTTLQTTLLSGAKIMIASSLPLFF